MTRGLRSPAIALFLFFQGLYALTSSGWVFRVPDELEVYFQVESLVDQGTLAVPQALAFSVEPGKPYFFGKRGVDGEPYAPYGPGVAFLLVPHHLAGRAVARLAGIDRARAPVAWRIVVAGITALAGATAGALAVAGLFRAARAVGASEPRAGALALTLGGATALWPEARTLFSEPFAAAALVWATALALEARAPDARRAAEKLGLAAALLALATLVKATNVLFALPLALAPLAARELAAPRRTRATLVLGSGVALAAVVHALWNLHRFGSATDLGYDWGETVAGPARLGGFGGSPARGLAVLLASPGKSLVVWAPAVAVLALPRARALARDPALAAAVLGPLALGLLAFSAYIFPEGGYCHGPRHLVPILPLLLLPAALGSALDRRALALAVGLGLLVNLPAAATSYLEDQVWRRDGSRDVYYELDRDPGPGLPANRYRLDYLPQVRLPALAARSLGKLLSGEPETPGTGLDAFALHLARARAENGMPAADRDALPASLGPLLALVAAALAAGGTGLAISTLLRTGNAAILPPRE